MIMFKVRRLAPLVLCQVDGVNESEIGKHLEIDFGQIVAGQVHSTNPRHRPTWPEVPNVVDFYFKS
jgi:hypothetical protein